MTQKSFISSAARTIFASIASETYKKVLRLQSEIESKELESPQCCFCRKLAPEVSDVDEKEAAKKYEDTPMKTPVKRLVPNRVWRRQV